MQGFGVDLGALLFVEDQSIGVTPVQPMVRSVGIGKMSLLPLLLSLI